MNEHGQTPQVVKTTARATSQIAVQAAAILAQGGLVVLPTDTVYGLAANANLESALRRVFAIKERPGDNPLPILLADADDITRAAIEIPALAHELAAHFWPGPLTIVLRKSSSISNLVTAGQPTVGLRVPDHSLARSVLRYCDFPVAVTSANLSGEPAATTPEQVCATLSEQVDLLIDDGPCAGGAPSTVLDLAGARPRIVRHGPVSQQDLEAVIGPIAD